MQTTQYNLPHVRCVRSANSFSNHKQFLTIKFQIRLVHPGLLMILNQTTIWRLLDPVVPSCRARTCDKYFINFELVIIIYFSFLFIRLSQYQTNIMKFIWFLQESIFVIILLNKKNIPSEFLIRLRVWRVKTRSPS